MLVILNHLPVYGIFSSTSGIEQVLFMFVPMIVRLNIPVFFMISGALLFPKDEDIKIVLKKRVSRIIALILFFDLIMVAIDRYLCHVYGETPDITPKDFILRVLNNKGIPGTNIYWYLYAYMGVLFVLPLMHRVAVGITESEMITLVILRTVVQTLFPMFNLYMQFSGTDKRFQMTDHFAVPFAFVDAFYYMLLGYYLEHKVDIKKVQRRHLFAMALTIILGAAVSIGCTYFEAGLNGQYSDYFLTILAYIYSGIFFIIVKYLFEVKLSDVKHPRFDKVIAFIGSMTLGIYMLDFGFKRLFSEYFVSFFGQDTTAQKLTYSFAWLCFSLTLGTICTLILKRIPGISNIV